MRSRILTVDDSQVIRNIVKKALKEYNCIYFEAENGQEGLDVAVEIKPHLIILDIDMPVMNGWDFLASLRFVNEYFANVPVVMLTANTGEKNVKRAEAMGVAHFIKKPFRPEELIKNINLFIELKSKSKHR